MIRHVFLWNVRPDAGPGAARRIVEVLDRLKDAPVASVSWSIGSGAAVPAGEDAGGRFQYALVCDYESAEQLAAYYSSPEHLAVADEVVPLIADRAVCDYEL